MEVQVRVPIPDVAGKIELIRDQLARLDVMEPAVRRRRELAIVLASLLIGFAAGLLCAAVAW